jgi:hypothetical protein
VTLAQCRAASSGLLIGMRERTQERSAIVRSTDYLCHVRRYNNHSLFEQWPMRLAVHCNVTRVR